MALKVLDMVRSKFLSLLNGIGTLLNAAPAEKDAKKGRGRKVTFPFNTLKRGNQKNRKKEIYSHKGSGYKGKGNVNTDAATFNRLRKEEHRGKQH